MVTVMKRLIKKCKNGSFTVEASILVPFMVMIIFVFICLCLYLHDRSVLSACASEAAGKCAAEKYETDEHLESALLEEAEELVEGRLLMLGDIETSVKVDEDEVTVTYTGSSALLWGISSTEAESAVRDNPVDSIRSSMTIKNLVESVAEGISD